MKQSRVSVISSENFAQYVRESETWSELLRKCGYKHPTNRVTVKKRVEKENLDTSHFKGCAWLKGKTRKNRIKLEKIMVEDSGYKSNDLKKRLIKKKILEEKCSMCDLSEWLGKPITLEMDHINGNNRDHRLENLRLLCCNCHSFTETYKGKNKERVVKEENKCMTCGIKIWKTALHCRKCSPRKKKVQRPTAEDLLKDLKKTNFSKVGRKYKVSCNSIRKWCKAYNLPTSAKALKEMA